MTVSQGIEERNLVPRWRPFQVSASLGELGSRAPSETQLLALAPDLEPLRKFVEKPSLHRAADALNLAFTITDLDPLRPVLEFVESADASPLLAAVAARVRRQLDGTRITDENTWFRVEDRHAAVSKLRNELRSRPRNPTKWVDLALAQTLLGQAEKARRSLSTALTLAPVNRFVVRSAVRFFIHIEDPEAAQHAVKETKGSADPWILAAELAGDEAAGKSSPSMRKALHTLSSGNFSSWELSELACTVAHAEFNDGRDKRARKFLEQARAEPTENAAAQLAFESQRGGFIVRPLHEPDRRYEAEAIEARWRYDWDAAIESGLKWQHDQPFAVEPAAFLSYVAAIGAERYDIAEQAAVTGRLANPQDATIANNLVFALVNQGKHDEAAKVLETCPSPQDEQEEFVYSATRGLMAFRGGSISEGRERYDHAVRKSLDLGYVDKAALAASFWAGEEMRANTTEAFTTVNAAIELAKRAPGSDADVVLGRVIEGRSAP